MGGHNERPNIFIVKTIIEQLHDRLKDDGISEDLIKHVEDRLGHDRRYGIDPTKIKNDLGSITLMMRAVLPGTTRRLALSGRRLKGCIKAQQVLKGIA